MQVAQKLVGTAEQSKIPVVVLWEQKHSVNSVYFSVYDGTKEYWAKLGRAVVTFFKDKGQLNCVCCKTTKSCVHKTLVKWYLAQEHPELLHISSKGSGYICSENEGVSVGHYRSEEPTTSVTFETRTLQDSGSSFCKTYPPSGQGARLMANYLMSRKKIPPDFKVPENAQLGHLENLSPIETHCVMCADGGELDQYLVTRKGKIYDKGHVYTDIAVFIKKCKACGHFYRYQEHRDGIHNFDDHVFLSVRLCHWFRVNLKNHTAVGRAADILSEDSGLHFPGDKMLQGYLHFEAMCDHKYNFTCDICGRFPCCLVTDANRKCAFPLALSQVPGTETATDGINMDVFWSQTVEASILLRGFGKEAANVGRVTPSYDNWAPFIGLARKDENAFNTEAEKVRSLRTHLQDTDFDTGDKELTEDFLIQMLCEKKVLDVRHWCTKMEVDAKGTKLEMINSLKEKLKSKSTFNKLFSSIWGHSGGWVSASCPHRIVYAFKAILRPESVRDHVDIILSMSRQPPVIISDVAPMMSRHGNKRRKNMFSPNEGRLGEATADNIKKAKEGVFSKSIPCMKEWVTVAPVSDNDLPTSNETFCLLDRFHEGNTKSDEELLRRITFVPEMKGSINSQVEEQLHREMNRNNYFLDSMSPGNYMFVLRLLLHFHNEHTNRKMTEAIKGKLNTDISYGEIRHDKFGRLHLSDLDNAAEKEEKTDLWTRTEDAQKHKKISLKYHKVTLKQLQEALQKASPSNVTTFCQGTSERLLASVTEHGLRFRGRTPGDGNCFFHAVVDQLQRLDTRSVFDHRGLRMAVVDSLRRYPYEGGTHLSNFVDVQRHKTWNLYLEAMSTPGEYVDHLVVQRTSQFLKKDIAVFTSSEDGTASDSNVVMICGGPGAAIMLGHYHEAHYQSLDFQRAGQVECSTAQADSSPLPAEDVFQDICNDDRRLDEIVVTIGPYRISKLDILTIAPILPKETEDQLRVKIDKETRWTVGWLNDQIINVFLYVLCQRRGRNAALSSQVIEGWQHFKSKRRRRAPLVQKEKLSEAEKVFIPIHRHGSHWTLLVLDVQAKRMRFYDPLNRRLDEEVVNTTREYMEYRLQNVPDDAIDLSNFNVEVSHEYTTQTDATSCGVCICIYAWNECSKDKKCDPSSCRSFIAKEILNAVKDVEPKNTTKEIRSKYGLREQVPVKRFSDSWCADQPLPLKRIRRPEYAALKIQTQKPNPEVQLKSTKCVEKTTVTRKAMPVPAVDMKEYGDQQVNILADDLEELRTVERSEFRNVLEKIIDEDVPRLYRYPTNDTEEVPEEFRRHVLYFQRKKLERSRAMSHLNAVGYAILMQSMETHLVTRTRGPRLYDITKRNLILPDVVLQFGRPRNDYFLKVVEDFIFYHARKHFETRHTDS
ncbi:uncharacterized protein LOC124148760 [Haliotis rufescens]|uniref:uncharacterized protein LOC124148760 n=2 Tax=Haliotis rufescens TaxID=6454 RepID=UPI00201EC70D|nr:uncharacterized protein LOC124148760 [Haliotis rufescens]